MANFVSEKTYYEDPGVENLSPLAQISIIPNILWLQLNFHPAATPLRKNKHFWYSLRIALERWLPTKWKIHHWVFRPNLFSVMYTSSWSVWHIKTYRNTFCPKFRLCAISVEPLQYLQCFYDAFLPIFLIWASLSTFRGICTTGWSKKT